MPELLLELGCEELPATFVRKAYQDLAQAVERELADAEVAFERGEPMGTPRRLIVHFRDVASRQPDRSKTSRGPGVKAAYDAEGKPTRALEGFCQGQGIHPSDINVDGDYVWATRTIPGAETKAILAEALPRAIGSLTFEKSMRWGRSRIRFARPIRWILAAFGGEAIPFKIEGVAAGLESRGHRFNHPQPFVAKSFQELVSGLREREVEPDPEVRRETILKAAVQVCSGRPELIDDLIEENVFLTEWPQALEGEFKAEYLSLPEPVLVTAMAKHERFFPVRDASGKLTNKFISIRNAGIDEDVRAGNAWVLSARFNDALFFYEEDRRHDIDWFLARTSGIVFQERLGTVRQRADRLASLTLALAKATGADEDEAELGRVAGLYCKADLASGLVGELPSLQGVVGGDYGERDGLPHPVCCAIKKHYDLSSIPLKDCEGSRTARRLLAADQLDKLVGYLGLGLVPSGSSDPYGLRRAVTTLIEIAWGWQGPFADMREMLKVAHGLYRDQGVDLELARVEGALAEIFASRYEALLPAARHDLLDAAMLPDDPLAATDPQAVRFRLACMEAVKGDTAFIQTATRPLNIVSAARKKSIPIQASFEANDLDSPEGLNLAKALADVEAQLESAHTSPQATMDSLKILGGPINAFFDSTMVMVEDERTRGARLALLEGACRALLRAGDFARIVIEGS